MGKKRKTIVCALWIALLICGIFVSDRVYAADSDFTIEKGVLVKYNGSGGSVRIPDGVTEIGAKAFYRCTNLKKIDLPDSIVRIGNYAFQGCENLTGLAIPNKVTEIGIAAFCECKSLEQFEISEHVTDIGGYALFGTPWLEKKKNESDAGLVIINHILLDGTKSKGSVTIPDTVKEIAMWAFCGCDELTGIVVPDNVTEIKDAAFSKCKNLSNVEISESVTRIGDSAFHQCESLTSITIPEGITLIENFTFYQCKKLTSITIPGSVTKIGEGAFYQCESLTSVKIPEGVTELEKFAFCGCTALSDIQIPAGITRIDGNAFYNTAWIDQRRAERGDSLVIVNDILIDGHKASGVVQVPDTVKKIACWAFMNNTDLTGIMLGQVTELESGAFQNCKGLTEIQIPDSITKIGDTVFAKTGLKTITFPKSVKEVGCGAVLGCSNLEKVTIENEAADVIKSDDNGTPNIFGAKGGNDESVDVIKVVDYKDKNICIIGYRGSTAYELANHIYNNAEDYGYETVQFVNVNDIASNLQKLLEEVKVTSDLSIRKGKSRQIKVTLPQGLTKADTYTGEEGQVNVTYKTNKKKVAVVDGNGRVAGKKRGSAKITTTVRLQDGTEKVFQTKVKVK